jgi:hypothetical protein
MADVDLLERQVGLLGEVRGVGQQRLAEAGQLHAARAPLEQLNSQLRLHLLHDATQRRLRHVQRVSGATQAAGFDDREKSPELSLFEGHARMLCHERILAIPSAPRRAETLAAPTRWHD